MTQNCNCHGSGGQNSQTDRINDNFARLADGKKTLFLNVNDRLADNDGRLFDGMMNERDKLHPK